MVYYPSMLFYVLRMPLTKNFQIFLQECTSPRKFLISLLLWFFSSFDTVQNDIYRKNPELLGNRVLNCLRLLKVRLASQRILFLYQWYKKNGEFLYLGT